VVVADRICTAPKLIPERLDDVFVTRIVNRYVPARDIVKGKLKAVGGVAVAPAATPVKV